MGVTTTYDTFSTTIMPRFDMVTEDTHRTIVSEMDSGLEERNNIWRFPKRSFNLGYRYLTTANRKTLYDFYRNQRGSWKPFWFKDFELRDWEDEYVGYGGPLDVDGALAADGAVFTDQIDGATDITANDMTLLPAAPALNDAYYFGHKAPFDKLTVHMGTAGTPAYVNGVSGWAVVWEYWDGNSWEALAGISDLTVAFTAAVGDHDVTWTMPTDWAIYEVEEQYLYWVRARVSDFETITIQPKGDQAWVSSDTFDLHSHTTTSASLLVYQDGVAIPADAGAPHYHFISGGGPAGRDRISFSAFPSTGVLITADYPGYLCCLARFTSDTFRESIPFNDLFNVDFGITEVFE